MYVGRVTLRLSHLVLILKVGSYCTNFSHSGSVFLAYNWQVAALQDKVRLMENENQVNRRVPENFSEIRGETLDHTLSTNQGSPQDSLGSAESRSAHHFTGEDGQQLRQSSLDNEFGHVRGNLETSGSTRKQHRPFIIYPKLKFKACSSSFLTYLVCSGNSSHLLLGSCCMWF